ncbi:MAG: [Fe-Fe] hydrogenase large subunit C-terminal domain-containing protein [Desulfomonilia bacterium]
MSEPVIMTNPARCRDCYRCVRNCDVKAIRVKEGQAQVVQELCILCGTCVRICPQKAKSIRSARQDILNAQKEGRKIVASVAPSAPAFFDMNSFEEFEKALKVIGFHAAEETAIGARIVAFAHREFVEKAQDRRPIIASACPVVVNLIEQYHPDLIGHLAPIVSPMIAHGRLLAKKYGSEAYIVFIGPCIAKKMENVDESVAGGIDAVMTFLGLKEWFSEKDVQFGQTRKIIERQPSEKARLFPIEGGLIGTAKMNTDILDNHMIVASGLDACHDVLNDIRTGRLNANLVELLACKGGCVNGPAMADLAGGIYLARQKIINFHSRHQPDITIAKEDWPPLERTYKDRKEHVPEFSEDEIQEVLHRVNKYTKDDELNCGACGYSSCREKAVATLRGMAEATMCIPYMRSRSESLRQVVMDVTPNSIIIIDNDLIIHDMSPSAEKLFQCKRSDVEGKHLSVLISVLDDFLSVRDKGKPVMGKARQLRKDLIAEQTIVRVEGQPLMVAIMRDVTEREREREKFKSIREETLERTREVVSKQMRVAHEIAHLLGETTAESKAIVSHLAKLLEKEGSK